MSEATSDAMDVDTCGGKKGNRKVTADPQPQGGQKRKRAPPKKSAEDSDSGEGDSDFEDSSKDESDFEDDEPKKKKKTPKAKDAAKPKVGAKAKARGGGGGAAGKAKAKAGGGGGGGGGKGGGGKKDTLTGDAANKAVLEYMQTQNRPYSAINVFDNLHGRVAKGKCPGILESLATSGDLIMKEYGKAKVFLAKQDDVCESDAAEAETSAEEIAALKETVAESKEKLNALKKEYRTYEGQLPAEEVANRLEQVAFKSAELNKEKEYFENLFKQQSSELPSAEEVCRITAEHSAAVKKWKQRKKICTEMADRVEETGEIDLIAHLGLDTGRRCDDPCLRSTRDMWWW
ncbi:unnamed protein product [Vitrella brassicaformis CCMP3155]|uniref:Homologous-pairing protein 2 winged helix domain-containing protein n=1 Tax=Vitrella brassicaformis (strain CCMP3155) TaxID=1169540 RepID=A0A0G4FU35_VITBC|nr:unnamed protein product [Vitrella brassicaformis CCMP3155]|eukprot:CEM18474.1 unnamed protein product [Vitrella brassicaformis CCMP3155]